MSATDIINVKGEDEGSGEDYALEFDDGSVQEEVNVLEMLDKMESKGKGKRVSIVLEAEVKVTPPVEEKKSSDIESVTFAIAEEARYGETDEKRLVFDTASNKTFESWDQPEIPFSLSTQQEESTGSSSFQDEEFRIDRMIYYELHDLYTKQIQQEKFKNIQVQAKLVEYYNRKRMFHAMIPEANQAEYQKRYEKILDELDLLNDSILKEQTNLQGEIEDLRNKRYAREAEVTLLFEKLQKLESDVGHDIINSAATATIKAYAERIVERLIKRQKGQIANLSKMRLTWIKVRNKYQETCDALNALNNLGPNLRLIDYEQLKQDNRNLHDKLEEKELSLTGIRRQVQNVMQILAHNREKVNALDKNIENFKENLESVTEEYDYVREQVHSLKKEKDQIRNDKLKLKDELGLQTRPLLLKDMERAIREIEQGDSELTQYRWRFAVTTEEVTKIRTKINDLAEHRRMGEHNI